ncbi:MAG TPA: DUF305 domain-containing protein [Leptolyngbyaceae cyanobacterium]
MKRSIAAIALFGLTVSVAGLPACTSRQATSTTEQPAESTNSSSGGMGQMEHGGVDQMDHSNMGMMEMDLGPADESFDLRFIDAMTMHHQGAVQMAEDALQKSERAEIQELATNIIEAQEREISQMKQWRQAWYPDVSDEPVMYDAQMGHMMPMSQEMKAMMMMHMDLGAADAEYDLRFINAMIPHHEGAVDMAKEALEKSNQPEIKQLAQDILDSQQPEIDQMTEWKQAWYEQ